MPRHTSLLLISLGVAAALLAACGQRQCGKPIVTVSLQPQKYMLEQITGDTYEIRCLLSNGGNPETYDPSFTNLMNAEHSVAYLRMGNIGFEDAIVDKIHESNPSLPIYNTSEGIMPVRGTHGHDETDPHTWTSIRNARVIARNMCRAMSEVDPANAGVFEANCRRFVARMDSLDSVAVRRLAPRAGQAFAVWHPSLSYFARDYGLRQIVIGGAEHKEASIPALKKHIDEARESGATVFFVHKELDGRNADAVTDRIGATRVDINPLSHDWLGQMTLTINAIANDGE